MISKRANGSEPGGPERIDMFCSGHLHEQQALPPFRRSDPDGARTRHEPAQIWQAGE